MLLRGYFIGVFVLLWLGMLLLYKKEEKLFFVQSAVNCYITQLCIGTVLAGIYSILDIPISLYSIGTGYLVVAIMIWGMILHQRKVQKIALVWTEFYCVLVLSVFFVALFWKLFTPELELIYKNSDPATHFKAALTVYDTHTVGRMYFSALYNGLVMELMSPFMVRLSLYKAFILADSFANYVNLLMFCVLLSSVTRTRFMKVVSPFVCILYFLGWPFYSYIVGGVCVLRYWGYACYVYHFLVKGCVTTGFKGRENRAIRSHCVRNV